MAAPLLSLRDIHIRFGNTQLLDGAELSVGEGEEDEVTRVSHGCSGERAAWALRGDHTSSAARPRCG